MKTTGSVGVAIIGGDRETVPTAWVGYRNGERHLPCARCKRNTAPSSLDTDGWCPACVGRYEKWKPTEVVAPMVVAKPRKSRAKGGPRTPRRRRDLKDIGATTEHLIERYNAGETATAIATTLGCDPKTVTSRLRAAGVKLRPGVAPRELPAGLLDQMIAAYKEGASLEVVGAMAGFSGCYAGDRLRDAGVTIRSNHAPREFPKDLVEAVRADRKSGMGLHAVAAKHRMGYRTAERLTKDIVPTGRAEREALIEQALKRYAAGEPRGQIAADLGIPVNSLDVRIQRAGLPRQRTSLGVERLDEVRALVDAGRSLRGAALELQVPPSTLADFIRRHNLSRKDAA